MKQSLSIAILPLLVLILATSALDAQPRRSRKKGACPEPYAAILYPRDTIYWLDVAPFSIPVMVGPGEATREVSGGAYLREVDAGRNLFTAIIERPMPGILQIAARSINCAMMVTDEKYLVVEKPTLRQARFEGGILKESGIDAWKGLTARVGELYDPSSEWMNIEISASHYQTVVTIRGVEAFNRPGVSFGDHLPEALRIRQGMKAEDIVTRVYWKPGGTADLTKWVLLISNQQDHKAVILLERRTMTIEQ